MGAGVDTTFGDDVTASSTTGAAGATLGATPVVTFEANASAVLGSATTDPGDVAWATDAAACSQLGAAAF